MLLRNKIFFPWYLFSSMAVGGQAVIEGVMMRSPHSMAVAIRRLKTKKIIIKEFQWVSLSDRFSIFKKPFFRGMMILIEAMMNGTSALSFSAEQASLEDEKSEEPQEALSKTAIIVSMVLAFGIGIIMFVVLPHFLTEVAGRMFFGGNLPVESLQFHFIDGLIKMFIFLAYVYLISFMPDIKRVFQYHGAEHKTIYAYEKNLELNVNNAAIQSRFHPRCGTSFIFTVIMASILVFSVVFPMLPRPPWSPVMVSITYALLKIPLMLPIVGISYEFIKFMGSDSCPLWLRGLSNPGLWMQNLTTREPDCEQLEVGVASLKACLWREDHLNDKSRDKDNLLEFESIESPAFENKLAKYV